MFDSLGFAHALNPTLPAGGLFGFASASSNSASNRAPVG
jgi:hypothetical protein